MGKFEIYSKVIGLLIAFIIIVGGVTYYEIPFGHMTLNEVYSTNPGIVWFLTSLVGIVFILLSVLNLYYSNTIKICIETNNVKSEVIENLSNKMLLILEENAKRHDLLMVKINENTEVDLKTIKRVDKIEDQLLEHHKRLKQLEA